MEPQVLMVPDRPSLFCCPVGMLQQTSAPERHRSHSGQSVRHAQDTAAIVSMFTQSVKKKSARPWTWEVMCNDSCPYKNLYTTSKKHAYSNLYSLYLNSVHYSLKMQLPGETSDKCCQMSI